MTKILNSTSLCLVYSFFKGEGVDVYILVTEDSEFGRLMCT